MFHIYIDHFALYMPGEIEDILIGRVFILDNTQGFLLAALASVTITALMIFLSVALPVTINCFTNIIVAMVYIPCTWFNLAGEAWMQREFGAVAEAVLLCIITLEA